MQLNEYFWDNRYQENDTGWDIGKISSPLKTYFDQLTNKVLKILIPGGGNSYEAEYLHKLGFKNVYVVDLSKTALNNILKRVSGFPKEHLIHTNFFELHHSHPDLKFDLIIEQTFFCAINPELRPNYAIQAKHLLKSEGKIVGLLFNDVLNNDKPPFGGNKEEYTSYFKPLFEIEIMTECYNSIESRTGRELFVKMVKK